MSKIIRSPRILRFAGWAEKLAELTKKAWTGRGGKCYFPYAPLTTAGFWRSSVAAAWRDGSMHSWVMVQGQRVIAHAALVEKDGYWEMGRWVALPDAPRGAVSVLCAEAFTFARARGWQLQVECTQAHTSSQFICDRLGMRFAGIGVLAEIDGVRWDIIYFDNLAAPPFEPRPGVLGDPLGREVVCRPEHRRRLAEIEAIITTERGGPLPPRFFHTLPHLVEPIRRIISLNR